MCWIKWCLVVVMLGLVGCDGPVDSMTVDGADGQSSSQNERSQKGFLPYPSGIDQQYADDYEKYATLAEKGEIEGRINFCFLSSAIAEQLQAGGKNQAAHQYHLQAAKVLRDGLDSKPEGLPPSMVGKIFFNEAVAMAASGRLDEANEALEFAFEQGFGDFDALESTDELADLRDSEGYGDHLEQWKNIRSLRLQAEVERELASGETFDFELAATDIAGNEQVLAEMLGKVVIVDVWGTWCPPCRAEIPSFVKLQKTYGDQGFQMIGLNYEREESEAANLAAVEEFVAQTGINYPCILGDDEIRAQIPDFSGFPTTLFIDKSGKVRMKAVGLHEYGFLEATVKTLLAE